ncbi:hypothetical protein SpCBS45565_g01145 [Spizellomyces sp. 'palustris']|nr:hypothetical protein SpCBS45565_g01145 [Spizellomyces sp. 'palustris']
MAFSGYIFESRQDVIPFAESSENGETLQWASAWARQLRAYVQAGYPRMEQSTTGSSPLLYNSVYLVSPDGTLVRTYDKHFLYEKDERWAEEGAGFCVLECPGLGKVGLGICMDLNPYRFMAPFDAYEFANFQVDNESQIILCSMAWILSLPDDDDSVVDDTGHESTATKPVMDTVKS